MSDVGAGLDPAGGVADRVDESIRLPAPPHIVWRYVTDPAAFSEWFSTPVKLDPRLGGEISFQDPLVGPVHGTVTELDPIQRIVFDFSTIWPGELVCELAPAGDDTLFRVVQGPFASGEGSGPGAAEYISAWQRRLRLLADLLASYG
ncbi:MAG TPA: SRPBCC domain-containing protein [Ardenticatenaceae bacterium]|nr:SRPBCC domain-containing protein [Ardenticatenaceae bacterium]